MATSPATRTYRAARFSAHQISSDQSLVHLPNPDRVLQCSPTWVSLLGLCKGARTLREHSRSLVAAGVNLPLPELTRALGTLVDAGLLVRMPEVRAVRDAVKDIPAITTIGVTTADRPLPLRRCLSSLVRQVDGHAGAVRIIVVDGSTSSRNESLGRSVTTSIAISSSHDITFIGRAERRAIRSDLRSICPEQLVDFALRPGASGNRNMSILLSSGEHALLVDDDAVCDVWRARSLRQAVDFCGHGEERQLAFFKTRAGARNGMVRATTNLLDAHRVLLGRSLELLAAHNGPRIDLSRACAFLLDGLAGVRRAVVRTTFSGLTGDTGTTYPERLIFTTGKWKTVLGSSREMYDTAFRYREVRRMADRYLVTHESACMGFCMGLANTSLVPPFLPTGRNEDGLFGLMLSAIDRSAVLGHIPLAVLHNSTRPSRYADYAFRSASETRIADLMIHLINSWRQSAASAEPPARLARLSEWLQDLAALDDREFTSVVVTTILKVRQSELATIEDALGPDTTYPDYWQRDLRRYRDVLLKNLQNPEFFLPIELRGATSSTGSYDKVRQFVRLSSDLLHVWPALWSAARHRARAV